MIYRVFLTDDHPLVREAVAWKLSTQDDLEVCGQSATRSEALQQILERKPDVCLTDMDLPDGSGMELMKDVQAQLPKTRFLFLSMFDEMTYAPRVITAGAHGYVMKDSHPDTVVTAVRQVAGGDIYASPAAVQKIMNLRQGRGGKSGVDTLSDREMEVFLAIGRGKSAKRIADDLCLSPKTIDTHRERIKSKLSVRDSSELICMAVMFASRPADLSVELNS